MNVLRHSGYALGIGAATALLAACGGSASQPPVAAGAAQAQNGVIADNPERDRSWMLPEAQSKDLLYAGNINNVMVFSYPDGKLEGKLRGFLLPAGECVDPKGNVYITDSGHGRIVEYAHGGRRPIWSKNANGFGCAIDPTTGNLAVLTTYGVEILKNGRGKPTTYNDRSFTAYYYGSYDKNGNLYIDGLYGKGESGDFIFAELPRGSTKFINIALDESIVWPGGVQALGHSVAVGDAGGAPVVYKFSIKGHRGTKIAAITLGSKANYVEDFFVQDNALIAANQYFKHNYACWDVLVFNYSSGGKATLKITDGRFPRPVVVSPSSSWPSQRSRGVTAAPAWNPPPGCTA